MSMQKLVLKNTQQKSAECAIRDQCPVKVKVNGRTVALQRPSPQEKVEGVGCHSGDVVSKGNF